MKAFFLALSFLFFSCTHHGGKMQSDITKMQQVWESADPQVAKNEFPDLKTIEKSDDLLVIGVANNNNIPHISFVVNLKDNRIIKASFWILNNSQNTVDFIKSQVTASDWKIYEHPIKQHPLRTEISEYSESKKISFLYDKLDSRKEVRVIYWGVDPKTINW